MSRPIMLGVVGDSASGKTTLTRGLVRVLGEGEVSHICLDDYHRYDRAERTHRDLTPLDPVCNHVDIMEQHMQLLRAGQPILKPNYRHSDGTFSIPSYLAPRRFVIIEGLLGFCSQAMRDCFDVRVYLDPPEGLRRRWKVVRDCSRRGYTTTEVLAELDRREPDAERFIRPQREHADIVVRFAADADEDDPVHLDAHLLLRPGLPHPDLSDVVDEPAGVTAALEDDVWHLRVSGQLPPATAIELEERVWAHMRFARHLRSERLGEFTIGTDLVRSDSLAITQLLVLYHLVTARAAVTAAM
jgi:phosphoribulokinase